MPQITDQAILLRDYDLEFVSKGPLDGIWCCQYLKCPKCLYYVLKGAKYDECSCGNISIDSDMLRVTVSEILESKIATYDAIKK